MGYTHYWHFKPAVGKAKDLEATYRVALKDCQRVCKAFYKEFGGLSGYSAHTPLGSYGGLCVNGKGEEAHEAFELREHFKENDGGFCKTARKPYDLVVVACLAILKHRLGPAIEVASDGWPDDWMDGVEYARKVTRLAIRNPIKKGE